jgi:beta-ureidopropionase
MKLRVIALQAPGWGLPAREDIRDNMESLVNWTDQVLSASPADVVVLPELSTTPYFCCRKDDRYVAWAEPIPGPSTHAFADVARRHGCAIVLPLFEQASDGRYYNAAAVIGENGELITGKAGDRSFMPYRKCHVPRVENPPDTDAFEDHYFSTGGGFPVFRTGKVSLGVLICYDRWFPESWRMLVSEGAELVVVPMVAWGFVETTYMAMLQSRAVENSIFVVTCNRSGPEELDGVRMDHFGRSTILAPDGMVLAGAAPGEGRAVVRTEIDLAAIERQRAILPLLRHRRVDLYGEPRQWIQGALSSTR